MKYPIWKLPPPRPYIPDWPGCTPLMAALLSLRGIEDAQEAHHFLYSTEDLIEDYNLLPDIHQAVARIRQAIADGEHVAVYGDYDVDGITSGCLLTEYLREQGLTCELYIPDRLEEGYGVNVGAVEKLHNLGVTLIITVDCGVTATVETDYAASLGIDMIITDHHECRETLPDAVAVIDPKRTDGDWPCRDMAGVGIAFKLVCALTEDPAQVLDRYADLLAVGTVADVMPLTGENRLLVRTGLEMLANGQARPGISALMEEAGAASRRPSAATLGFTLAPRINAAGRLSHTEIAVELLLTQDPDTARELAQDLCRKNRERQSLETAIWKQALAILAGESPDVPLVVTGDDWHQGVIGIVASRLTDYFSVPAIMISFDGDHGKGSCRSVAGFNLFEALSACSDCLEGFGGHAMAAGLTIHRNRVDEFRKRLADFYCSHRPDYVPALEPELTVNSPLLLSEECVTSLDLLEPCGCGNPRPLLYLDDALLEDVIPIGGGKHLRLHLRKNGAVYEGVFFSRTAEELGASAGDRVDLVFSPQINEFRGHRSVQLILTDLRVHDCFDTCRRLLIGESVFPDETAEYLPIRRDFADLWRTLSHLGGTVALPLSALSDRFHNEPIRTSICLAVMDELGLAQIRLDNEELLIIQNTETSKVDLDASALLQQLRTEF
ncbi:MAG: single-stranded-DNA-specific exonuclease RecJ [Eubacteriales bacterium]|nr:single-stranded-DNA-specific exonuclease RecJ [Eubacteriales bacterium]